MRIRELKIGMSAPTGHEIPLRQADAASARALVLAEIGQLQSALGSAERIRDPDLRESTFQAIARTRKIKARAPRMAWENLRTFG